MSKKQRKSGRYGMKKVKVGEKLCWLSAENRHGWSLGLAFEEKTYWLKNVRFSTGKAVAAALEKSKIVFIKVKGK